MKSFIKIMSLLLLPAFSTAQQNPYWEELTKEQFDSLRLVVQHTTNDTLRMAIARSFSFYYQEIKRDSSLYFSGQQLKLAKQLKLKLWEADALDNTGYVLSQLKDYPRSLQSFIEGLKIAGDEESEKHIWRISTFTKEGNPGIARLTVLANTHHDIARLYEATRNPEKELSNYFEAIKIAESINEQSILSLVNMNLGIAYLNMDKLDSALVLEQKALNYSNTSGFQKYKGRILSRIGTIDFKKGNYALAKQYFSEAITEGQQQDNLQDLAEAFVSLANLFSVTGNRDSSLWYAKKGLEIFQSTGSPDGLITAYTSLSSIYKLRNNPDSAFIYQGLAMAAKDSLNNVEKIKQFENIGFDEQLRLRELEEEKIQFQNTIRTYVLLAAIAVFMLVAFLLFRNNRNRKKANTLLQQQKKEIEQQKKNVEETLTELKSTQSQLIQSEKMASLGELTAGIAHEIQNPLNFVNNFSELNTELMEEIKGERSKVKSERDEQLEDELLNDIAQNMEKITHHGKRADAIVKGMLQHSRSSSSVKEPTDINALADEYLRLAYHGLRAKDKSFNATLHTHFDETLSAGEGGIGKINITPQDIGRAILNLFNNAFYAVAKKKKALQFAPGGGVEYEPTVSVSTKRINNKIEIRVKDNGNGIPQKILDKIFQPFFTTKPTGQGTGLGLSLSYDIVKAHGGEIKVESKEGEGSEFIIQIPGV